MANQVQAKHSQAKHFYEFGVFRLDLDSRLLFKDGQRVPLAPKALAILQVLLDNRCDPLVEKEALLRAIWPEVFVEESNLTHHISALRKALGNGMSDQSYIETIPKRGYRFVGEVKEATEHAGDVAERAPAEPSGAPTGVRPTRRKLAAAIAVTKRRRMVGLALAVTVVVAIAVAIGVLLHRAGQVSWKNATFTQLTNQAGEEIYPSLSPDGRSFVYASRASGNWDIYLQRVGGKNPINLTKDSPADDTEPAFSPDGERIAFRSEREGGGIFVMGATGESAKRLTDFGHNPAWSPDGRQIVCATGAVVGPEDRTNQKSQLFVISAGASSDSSERRLIISEMDDAVQPSWSPGGRRIAFWSIRDGNRDVWTAPATGGAPVQVTREASTDWHPVWSHDGKHLYFLSNRRGSMNLWRVPIDENSGQVRGPADQVTTPSAYTLHFSLARDGRRFVYVNRVESSNIHEMNFDPVRETAAGARTAVTQGSWKAVFPDVSPDGQKVAFSTTNAVFVISTNGDSLRQLTDDERRDLVPRWAPDGKLLAFHSNRSGTYQIWTIAPDGGGLRQLTRITGRGTVNFAVWSPDGVRLAFSVEDGPPLILAVDKPWDERSLESLPPVGAPNVWFQAFSWSPDGRRLAGWRGTRAVSDGISIYSFDSRQYQHFTEFGWQPRWLSDGQRLMFWRFEGIYLLDTRSRKVRQILSAAPSQVMGAALSRDDRYIYFGLTSVESDVWLMSLE